MNGTPVSLSDTRMTLRDHLKASLLTSDTSRRRLLEAIVQESLDPRAREMEAA